MSGLKTFINNTNKDLYVTLYVRKGDKRTNGNAGAVSFELDAGRSCQQAYGDSENIYLNSIKFSWDDDGARLAKEQEVVTDGCWWDDELNTNNTVIWNSVGRADITCKNS